MKRNLNPHEARMVAKILEDPKYDDNFDSYQMAADIVRTINEYRQREKLWVVAAQAGNRPATMIGPFTTVDAARRAMAEAAVGYGNTPVQMGIWRVRSGLEEEAEDQ